MAAKPPSDSAWPAGSCVDGPITGLKVLDFTRILAGPYATMHLAALGADVIKVERPGRGDETRRWGPPFGADGATYFAAVNQNKRSIALDLTDEAHLRVAAALAREADVVVDNFLPGKMAQFGLDHERLRSANPQIITASISGFGRDNEYSTRPGFDFLAQAMGGLMAVTGEPSGEPLRVGVAVTDLMSGVFLCSGVLAVLAAVRAGADGQHIDVALLDTQISMLANVASGWLISGVEHERFGNRHPSIAPYETLTTSDGVIAVAIGTDQQFEKFCRVLGKGALAQDMRYATNTARVANRHELISEIQAVLQTRPSQVWLELLVSAQVPAAPVNSVREALSDPVVRNRMIATVDGVSYVRSPIAVDGRLPEVLAPPPKLGQHTSGVVDFVDAFLRSRREESVRNTLGARM